MKTYHSPHAPTSVDNEQGEMLFIYRDGADISLWSDIRKDYFLIQITARKVDHNVPFNEDSFTVSEINSDREWSPIKLEAYRTDNGKFELISSETLSGLDILQVQFPPQVGELSEFSLKIDLPINNLREVTFKKVSKLKAFTIN